MRLLNLAGAFAALSTIIIVSKAIIVKSFHLLEVYSQSMSCINAIKMALIYFTFHLFASTNFKSNTESMTMHVLIASKHKRILNVYRLKNKKNVK